ncbi:TniB family NTP-binding protein [Thalassorhabdomicrobium marinisediminis]|uniref:ATP-binding protein n=1 Tax=Thalassorhabdomicrobium marinisediminis TaxID=2170577 RepID=A0A2T7FT06_9RHOB|nr:TniB family NTP-binding protein [Thalassorhabdomicrobium marinisediminis]PVA05272.1 ATP-binding protein [Thalassorhabdomicrobium marinisediminis]
MTKTIQEVFATMKSLRSQHVVTERDRNFEAQLLRQFEVEDGQMTHEPVRYTGGTETNGIAFIEGSGGGKTTAIIEVLRNFEPLSLNPETGEPRYLHVKVESPATLRSLGVAILGKLGADGVAERTKVYDVWNLVRFQLARRGITLLWLDEAHDLFRSATSAETDNMFKMLKGLMQGDHPVVLVLSGTERLSAITGLDPQVNRRFIKIRPKPLAFGVDNNRLKALVQGYAEKAGLDVALDDDVINRLIYGSRYRFGRFVVNVLEAIECALMDDVAVLEVKHFEDAWAQREGCDVSDNVFTAVEWMSIDLEDEGEEVEMRTAVQPRAKRKKGA